MFRQIMVAGLVLTLAGCGGASTSRSLETAPAANAGIISDYPVKIGQPYELDGVTYTPSDVFNYDEAGYASWYGAELNGRNTANGELFDPEAITGAHRTLPLPSYVEVTALDSGRTILVRLNDRGPAARNRLIDLSYGAAKQLGVADKGVFAVRVRRVNPPETERVVLRRGQAVKLRMDTPESLLVPLRRRLDGVSKPGDPRAAAATASSVPSATSRAQPTKAASKPPTQVSRGNDRFIREGDGARPVMAESSTGDNRVTWPPAGPAGGNARAEYFVQVAAFGTRSRADALAKRIGASTVTSSDGRLFRVRYGPYADARAAEAGISQAKKNGYNDARIQQGDTP
ncbi:septal ring lytic transglycosylase RlpA family protein [Blastomonas sp.]|uniref:septal ring lytic transglycosylase RlpA family protein n=1 Tax=Blastomonas sp. TaxID=1909299 RepID=UPI003593F8E1